MVFGSTLAFLMELLIWLTPILCDGKWKSAEAGGMSSVIIEVEWVALGVDDRGGKEEQLHAPEQSHVPEDIGGGVHCGS